MNLPWALVMMTGAAIGLLQLLIVLAEALHLPVVKPRRRLLRYRIHLAEEIQVAKLYLSDARGEIRMVLPDFNLPCIEEMLACFKEVLEAKPELRVRLISFKEVPALADANPFADVPEQLEVRYVATKPPQVFMLVDLRYLLVETGLSKKNDRLVAVFEHYTEDAQSYAEEFDNAWQQLEEDHPDLMPVKPEELSTQQKECAEVQYAPKASVVREVVRVG